MDTDSSPLGGQIEAVVVASSPSLWLGDAHVSEAPSCDDSMKFFETMFEGNRSRRLGRRVAIPSTELGDDPTGPFEGAVAMGVFLQLCGAFDLGSELVENGNFVFAEGDSGRFGIGCGTGLDKLHGGDRGLGGDGGELDEAFGGFELTVFEAQPLKFQQSPELLDGPAHPVPIDDLPGGLDVGDVVSGEQPPVNSFGAGGAIALDHFDEADCGLACCAGAPARSCRSAGSAMPVAPCVSVRAPAARR